MPMFSTIADHSLVMLESVSIFPFWKMCTTPELSRRVTVRNSIFSTSPSVPLITAQSPVRNWSSNKIKNPEMKSRTSSCAPKPTAKPTIPALARMGAILILNLPRSISRKMTHKKILPIPYIIPVSVLIRFSASPSSMSAALWALVVAIFDREAQSSQQGNKEYY